ncbi:MAG: hypothetical protein Q4C70_05345 [Planctomycetia bacterium]|nr:hypothetical protein [Planctomycetia bacterium]
MEYPLEYKPKESWEKCQFCGQEMKYDEPHYTFSLEGLLLNQEGGSAVTDLFHVGMLWNMTLHTENEEPTFKSIDIIDELNQECVEFSFCSFSCLRKWVNQILDDCEKKFEEAKQHASDN